MLLWILNLWNSIIPNTSSETYFVKSKIKTSVNADSKIDGSLAIGSKITTTIYV